MIEYPLPNYPDWSTANPEYSDEHELRGKKIIERNKDALLKSDVIINYDEIPTAIQEILGLSEEELEKVVSGNNNTPQVNEITQQQVLLEKFLTAKFLNDFLKPRLRPGKFEEVIRRPAEEYDGKSAIECLAQGDYFKLVGGTYDSFDLYNGS